MNWLSDFFSRRDRKPETAAVESKPDPKSELIFELTRKLITLVNAQHLGWNRAFYRFCNEPSHYGSNASYVVGAEATLVDSMRVGNVLREMNEMARKLFALLGKEQGVLLLIVDPPRDFDVKFEYQDLERWKITKLDGATGIPAGL